MSWLMTMPVRSALRSSLCAVAAAAALALCASVPSEARSLDDAEKASLAKTVTEFDAAMRDKTYERIISTVPPKMLNAIAAKAGVPAEQVRQSMVALMKSMNMETTIVSFGMDLPAAKHQELKSGTPYALIPTTTVIATDKNKIAVKSQTLALMDEGQWYLVRVSEAAQVMILREVYPEFASVEFPQGSMEELKK